MIKKEDIKMADEIMIVEELVKYLKTGVATIYKLAQEGKIPATKVGNQWRFSKEKIDEWMDHRGKVSFKEKNKKKE